MHSSFMEGEQQAKQKWCLPYPGKCVILLPLFQQRGGRMGEFLEDLSQGKKLVWWALHSQQLDGGKNKSDLKRKAREG